MHTYHSLLSLITCTDTSSSTYYLKSNIQHTHITTYMLSLVLSLPLPSLSCLHTHHHHHHHLLFLCWGHTHSGVFRSDSWLCAQVSRLVGSRNHMRCWTQVCRELSKRPPLCAMALTIHCHYCHHSDTVTHPLSHSHTLTHRVSEMLTHTLTPRPE